MFKLIAIANRLTDSDTYLDVYDDHISLHSSISDITMDDFLPRTYRMTNDQIDEFKKRQQEFQEYERTFDWNAYGRERDETFLMTREDRRRG